MPRQQRWQPPPLPSRFFFPTRHSVLAMCHFSAASVIFSTRIADNMKSSSVWNKNQRRNRSKKPLDAGAIHRGPKRRRRRRQVEESPTSFVFAQAFGAASSRPRRAPLLLRDASFDSRSVLAGDGRAKENGFQAANRDLESFADFFHVLVALLPSTVSGLLEAEVLATLSARIGAASELPPLANAEPDERVTRGEGLSAQFMAARGGGGRCGEVERKKSRNVEASRAFDDERSSFSFFALSLDPASEREAQQKENKNLVIRFSC